LDNLNQNIIDRLVKTLPVTLVEYLAPVVDVTLKNIPAITEVKDGNKKVTVTLNTNLPEERSWFEFLAGNNMSWWKALLTSSQFSAGSSRVSNGVKTMFKPRPGHKYVTTYADNIPTVIQLFNSTNELITQVNYEKNSQKILVTLYHPINGQNIPLQLEYKYQPETGNQALILSLNNNSSIKNFYNKIWFSSPQDFANFNLKSEFCSKKTILKEDIERFSNSIAGAKPTFNMRSGK
jgi:fatty acid synthase subunit alpha